MNFLREILQNILKSNKLNKAWRWTATFLAAVVVFVTTYSLILPAITMESTTAESMPGIFMEGQTEITQPAEEELLSSEPVETYEDGSGIQTAAEPESSVLPDEPEGGTDSTDNAESEDGTDPVVFPDGSDDGTCAGTDSSDNTEEELTSSDEPETNSTPAEENIPQTESLTAMTENTEAVVSYVSGALFSSKFNLSLKELKKDAEKYNVYRKIAQSKASTDPDDPGDWFGCDARIFAFDFTDEEGNDVTPSEEVWAEIRLQEPMKADLCKIVLLTDDQVETSGEAGETDYNNIKAQNNNTLQIKHNEDNMIVGLRFKAEGFSVYAVVDAPEPVNYEPYKLSSTDEIEVGKAYLLSYGSPEKYFTSSLNGKGCLIENTDSSQAAEWYFESTESDDTYSIYTMINGEKKYIKQVNSENKITLADAGTALELSLDTAQKFLFKHSSQNLWLQHSNGGGGIRFYTDANNKTNARIIITEAETTHPSDDPYDLKGKSFGIAYNDESVTAAAMTSESKQATNRDLLRKI